MFEGDQVVALWVAALGAGGLGATAREIIGVIIKLFGGMSAREDGRKKNLVEEREEALAEKEQEAKKRRILEEALSTTRRLYIENAPSGAPPLPAWPVYERATGEPHE